MKLLDGIVRYFKTPRRRDVYAVTGGNYIGELLVYIEKVDGNFCFLSVPNMKVRIVPESDVYSGIGNDLLDKVEKLPRDVYLVCCEQYKVCSESRGTDDDVPRNIPSKT